MSLILSVHTGSHDAAAALFDDYELLAAVQLERLTRIKCDGHEHPDLAIDEVLSIAGATRQDADAICFSRSEFPTIFYKNITGVRWLREKYRKYVEKNTRRYMPAELLRYHTPRLDDIFKVAEFRRASGFRDDAQIYFYNHHESHALAPLFYTGWDDALLVTADGGGDTVNYSHRHFADGAMTTIYGGEECLLTPLPAESLGQAYETMTAALGFIPRRHEGKLTGLAALGQPVLAEKIAARFFVDDAGRVRSNFADLDDMHGFLLGLAAGVRREDVATSIQQVLEDTMLRSVARLLERHKARHLGLAGGVFANVRLNRVLAERLPLDEIFIFPAMGDEGMPAGGALCYLLQRDGLAHWLKQRRPLRDVYLGRDYTDAIDKELAANAGVRRTGSKPGSSAPSIPDAWNTGRGRSARARSSPIRRGAKPTICSTVVWHGRNSCRLRR